MLLIIIFILLGVTGVVVGDTHLIELSCFISAGVVYYCEASMPLSEAARKMQKYLAITITLVIISAIAILNISMFSKFGVVAEAIIGLLQAVAGYLFYIERTRLANV